MKRDPRVDAAIELDELFYGKPGTPGLLQTADSIEAQQLNAGIAFVQKLCDAAGDQPSVATGYLRDILEVLRGRKL